MSAHWHCSTEQASLWSYAHQRYLLKEPMRISTSKKTIEAIDHFTSGYWIVISDLQWHYIIKFHQSSWIPCFLKQLLPTSNVWPQQQPSNRICGSPGSPHDVSPSSLSVGWSWSLGNCSTSFSFQIHRVLDGKDRQHTSQNSTKTAWHLRSSSFFGGVKSKNFPKWTKQKLQIPGKQGGSQ